MKLLDYIIVALIVGCMFIGYSGHRFVAILLLTLVVILASWRFWDREREKDFEGTGGSGELNPEHDKWADVGSGDDAGDSGGRH